MLTVVVLVVAPFVGPSIAAVSAATRQALLDLYQATNDVSAPWVSATGWSAGASNVFLDPCTPVPWFGVVCDASDTNLVCVGQHVELLHSTILCLPRKLSARQEAYTTKFMKCVMTTQLVA